MTINWCVVMTKKSAVQNKINNFFNQSKASNVSAITATLLFAFLSITSVTKVSAAEWGAQVMQGSDSGSNGYGITLSDKFSHRSPFSWTLGYSKLNDVVIEWNNNELEFPIETVDGFLSYRFTPHSYNPTATGLSYDLFAGASLTISENKSTFESPNYEKYFSETNDINLLLGAAVRYTFNRTTSMQLGLKYYPSFSEFDSVSALYLGVNYRFGRNLFF